MLNFSKINICTYFSCIIHFLQFTMSKTNFYVRNDLVSPPYQFAHDVQSLKLIPSLLSLYHTVNHSWQSHTNPRMLLSLVQSTITSSLPFQSSSNSKTLSVLPKSLFLGLGIEPTNDLQRLLLFSNPRQPRKPSLSIHASLIEAPVLWAGRLCIFYALLRTGLAGSQANPLVSGLLSQFFRLYLLTHFTLNLSKDNLLVVMGVFVDKVLFFIFFLLLLVFRVGRK